MPSAESEAIELVSYTLGTGRRVAVEKRLPVSDNPREDDGHHRWFISFMPMTAVDRLAYIMIAPNPFAASREIVEQQWDLEISTIHAFRLPAHDPAGGAIVQICFNCEPTQEPSRKVTEARPYLETASPKLLNWIRQQIDNINALSEEMLTATQRLQELLRKSGLLEGTAAGPA